MDITLVPILYFTVRYTCLENVTPNDGHIPPHPFSSGPLQKPTPLMFKENTITQLRYNWNKTLEKLSNQYGKPKMPKIRDLSTWNQGIVHVPRLEFVGQLPLFEGVVSAAYKVFTFVFSSFYVFLFSFSPERILSMLKYMWNTSKIQEYRLLKVHV